MTLPKLWVSKAGGNSFSSGMRKFGQNGAGRIVSGASSSRASQAVQWITEYYADMRRLSRPWEYRRRRAVAGVRFAGGGFNLGIGLALRPIESRTRELAKSGANPTGGQRADCR